MGGNNIWNKKVKITPDHYPSQRWTPLAWNRRNEPKPMYISFISLSQICICACSHICISSNICICKTCLPSGWGSPLWTSFQFSFLHIRKGPGLKTYFWIYLHWCIFDNNLTDEVWLKCDSHWRPKTSDRDPGYSLALSGTKPQSRRPGRKPWIEKWVVEKERTDLIWPLASPQ